MSVAIKADIVTHGSARSCVAFEEEIVNRGDWRLNLAASEPETTSRESRQNERMLMVMVGADVRFSAVSFRLAAAREEVGH